jgi:chromosome segregation ATPase
MQPEHSNISNGGHGMNLETLKGYKSAFDLVGYGITGIFSAYVSWKRWSSRSKKKKETALDAEQSNESEDCSARLDVCEAKLDNLDENLRNANDTHGQIHKDLSARQNDLALHQKLILEQLKEMRGDSKRFRNSVLKRLEEICSQLPAGGVQ